MIKRRIYIARRIASNTDPEAILPLSADASIPDVLDAYARKSIERDAFIHNGHWILRPASMDGALAVHNLPSGLAPAHIFEAVQDKILSSDAFIAVLSHEAYGAIAELGYAAGTGKIAVYVLPEHQLSGADVLELWLSFQIALSTRDLWDQRDIDAFPDFARIGVRTLEEYTAYIGSLIPAFLKP